MTQTLVVLAAGESSRFRDSVGRDVLKCVYREAAHQTSLLGRLLDQAEGWVDHVVVVAGHRVADLKAELAARPGPTPTVVVNPRARELGSNYSMHLGLAAALSDPGCQRIVCLEADLVVDTPSLRDILARTGTVISATTRPIRAQTSVVYYRDTAGRYRYIFDESHNQLEIGEPFTEIGNSGQVWAFADLARLGAVMARAATDPVGFGLDASLGLVDAYLAQAQPEVVTFGCWHNCNTVADLRSALTCPTPGCGGHCPPPVDPDR